MSSGRPLLVLAVNQLGFGGTEKAMVSLARSIDRDRFALRVVALHDEGPRLDDLVAAGIEVIGVQGDRDALIAALEGAEIVDVHRDGGAERLLPAACRAAGVRVLVETNTFGAFDSSADEHQFDCHLFPSKMCALRYRQQVGLTGAEFFQRHAVVRWPVEVQAMRFSAPERADAKRRLGLDPDRPVIVRTGRDDDRKWRNLLIDMLPHLLALRADVQIVYGGVTSAKMRRLDRLGLLPRVRLMPLMGQEELAVLHGAADVYLNASEIGESLGVAMVEAMALGVPVVTCSTPWVDNAQIELVDNGVNGYVASHPVQFAEAVAALLEDADLAKRLGDAAARKATAQYDAARQTQLVERIYETLLKGGEIGTVLDPTPAEIDAFEGDYELRLEDEFRPLTVIERRQVRRQRQRERIDWTLRAIRHADRRTVAAAYWLAHARVRPGLPSARTPTPDRTERADA